jgi:hypothetical protein
MDFYLAGIPLDYDSLGVNYSFESSGMCELIAHKNGVPVFVNTTNKPKINMVSENTSKTHSIYFLDTVNKNWMNREMSAVTDLRNSSSGIGQPAAKNNIVEPLKPERANDKSPIIEIDINPNSFQELLIYDNLKFQLEANEKSFKPEDANELWQKVELVKRNDEGLYTVNFKNAQRSVSYSARPVLEGEDYNKALLVFERKNEDYKRQLTIRLEKEKSEKEEYERMVKLNALIELRNIELKKENKRASDLAEFRNNEIEEENKRLKANYDKKVKEIENQNAINEGLNKEYEQKLADEKAKYEQSLAEQKVRYEQNIADQRARFEKSRADRNQSGEIIRSFTVDGFGIWNCDKAFRFETHIVNATFKDSKGNILDLSNIAVAFKDFNGIQKFPYNQIQFVKNAESMIFSVNEGKLAYLSYADFAKLNITPDTKEQTFIMKTVPENKSNYAYLKELAER